MSRFWARWEDDIVICSEVVPDASCFSSFPSKIQVDSGLHQDYRPQYRLQSAKSHILSLETKEICFNSRGSYVMSCRVKLGLPNHVSCVAPNVQDAQRTIRVEVAI